MKQSIQYAKTLLRISNKYLLNENNFADISSRNILLENYSGNNMNFVEFVSSVKVLHANNHINWWNQ